MVTPFENDIFSLIWQAFKNLYPGKDCTCFWDPLIENDESGAECFGVTQFGDDGYIQVCVKPTLPVCDCAEIFAHELAHVAVGDEHGHDSEWEKAFDDIFREYNRIGDELFNRHDPIPATDGKSYVKDGD